MGIFSRLLNTGHGKQLKELSHLVTLINNEEPALQQLGDSELVYKTTEFKQRLANGESVDDLLVEAFAVTREAARRVIGQRHYDVQLMGGAALHFGWVAQMRTGEGKTLAATLPAYLNALSGDGVHLVTANEYLAARDAEWMGQIHRFLGLTVGLVIPGNDDISHKKRQYACDITYGTNSEFGFDYLRDNMAMSPTSQVQRGHAYVIVDEVDSILIDEARTPLIISGHLSDTAETYQRFASLVKQLSIGKDYEVDEENRVVAPLETGVAKIEKWLGIDNLYDAVSNDLVRHLGVALEAKELYHRDKDYIVENGEVLIVDEFTGRVLDGRRWSEGLHQAVEAKEGVTPKAENHTLASVTLQNYFRLYTKIAGMTGTAETEASEFLNTYGMSVIPIPTHKPQQREDHTDVVYKSIDAKHAALIEDVAQRHRVGQPVLVGTASVATSEQVSKLLNKAGIKHEVLNAKAHRREAEIISQAGRLYAVTVATNMAGRGVDILLGGNATGLALQDVKAQGLDPETEEGQTRLGELLPKYETQTSEEREKVLELGGLYVCGTERHESRRIDNQLRGRAGRQGDPGESRFYLSLEDDLMRLFATGAISWALERTLADDQPIEAKMVTKSIERAQTTVEQRNSEQRKNVLQYDEVLDEQRKAIYEQRNSILEGDNLKQYTTDRLIEIVDDLIETYTGTNQDGVWDTEGLRTELFTFWPTQLSTETLATVNDLGQLQTLLVDEALEIYEQQETVIGVDLLRNAERQILLQVADLRWRNHLAEMDYLQEGIQWRAVAQNDPLMEWRREGYNLFVSMTNSIKHDYVKQLMRAKVVRPELTPQKLLLANNKNKTQQHSPAAMSSSDEKTVADRFKHVSRNALCPCGSNKKFKLCHGR